MLFLLSFLACTDGLPVPEPVAETDTREPCADNDPLRQVFWGDLHAHSQNSFDAWVFDVRNTVDDAYAFASGEPTLLPPLGPDGEGTVPLQLSRPLDFAAVTDHGEYLGEVRACTDPASTAYDTLSCQAYREADDSAILNWGFALSLEEPVRNPDICDNTDCVGGAGDVWAEVQQAAERWYDRTAECSFTSFVGYEYSAVTNLSNLHRVLIFRNKTVQDQPTAYFEYDTPLALWRELERSCLDLDNGCDVIGIPHNSNWSNGQLFHIEYPEESTEEQQRELARLRAELEPIVELYQHKGDSECSNGLLLSEPDPLCDFEKLRQQPFDDCGETPGSGAIAGFGCLSRNDFLRGFLGNGMVEEARIGVNPLALGVVAATDTHNGIPGAVDEANYLGHWGNNEDLAERRLDYGHLTPAGVIFSGGGLMGVWAEENSRDSLFDAMKRKETFGTSGPRIPVRFFGGESLPDGLCEDPSLVQTAYEQGVPMGGTLEAPAQARFVVDAWADPEGVPLQRVQIVKGWVAPDGTRGERVYEVAGDPVNGATVDLETCLPEGEGAAHLCTVWDDPDYDPEDRAFYYVRVVENPSCRWTWRQCLAITEEERPPSCEDPSIPKQLQERAWTSPIWITPAD